MFLLHKNLNLAIDLATGLRYRYPVGETPPPYAGYGVVS
jgi:hypothetical protein